MLTLAALSGSISGLHAGLKPPTQSAEQGISQRQWIHQKLSFTVIYQAAFDLTDASVGTAL